jgi:hypothetical protein
MAEGDRFSPSRAEGSREKISVDFAADHLLHVHVDLANSFDYGYCEVVSQQLSLGAIAHLTQTHRLYQSLCILPVEHNKGAFK